MTIEVNLEVFETCAKTDVNKRIAHKRHFESGTYGAPPS